MEKKKFSIRIEPDIVEACRDASLNYRGIKHPDCGSFSAYARDQMLRGLVEDGIDLTDKYPLLGLKNDN